MSKPLGSQTRILPKLRRHFIIDLENVVLTSGTVNEKDDQIKLYRCIRTEIALEADVDIKVMHFN